MIVRSPVEGFIGSVAGVVFVDGRAETTDRRALSYFRRHGYLVDDEPTAPAVEDRVDAREAAVPVPIGTPLRDAAVDPKPGDFLPPPNAGRADPHGPDVVSPGLHAGQGVRPVLPGPVSGDARVQQAAETADAAASTGVALARPARNASKADWKAYALSVGGDPDEVEVLTRDALADKFSSDPEEEPVTDTPDSEPEAPTPPPDVDPVEPDPELVAELEDDDEAT